MRPLSVSIAIFFCVLTLPVSLAASDEAPSTSDATFVVADAAVVATAPSSTDDSAVDDGAAGTSRAFCRATCGDTIGSVSISCSGSCTAVDQNCPNQRGYVECDGQPSTRKYCGQCDDLPCSVARVCPGGSVISCTGSNNSCFGGGDLCFVSCDGNVTYCPGNQGLILCGDEFGF